MFGATFCWAGNMVAIKEGLRGFSPLALTQLRITAAGLIFVLLFVATKRLSALRLTRRDWIMLALAGVSGVTLNQLCFIAGLARSSVTHAGLIVALGPIMVLVLSCAIRLEALTVQKFAGMLISFGGVAILTLGKQMRGDGGLWVGDMILLLGSAFFAVYTILVKEVADKIDALSLNSIASVVGVPLMLPFAWHATTNVNWSEVPTQGWWGLGYAILFGSVVPYLIFASVMKELTAARVAAFSYIQPVIATGLGVGLMHEKLTAKIVIGGVLIFTGVYVTERERGEEQAVGSRK